MSRLTNSLFPLPLVLLLVAAAPASAQSSAGAAKLAEAKAAVELNCGDCYPRTREGVLRTIELLNESLAAGADRVEALPLLAEMQNVMAIIYAEFGSPEFKRHWDARKAALVALVEIRPEDAEAHYLLGTTAETPAVAIEHLEKAAAIEPKNTEIRLSLSLALIDGGRTDRGFTEGVKVMSEASDAKMARRYAIRIGEALERRGKSAEAEVVRGMARRPADQ